MNAILVGPASDELQDAVDYYNAQFDGLGFQFYDCFQDTIRYIKAAPVAWVSTEGALLDRLRRLGCMWSLLQWSRYWVFFLLFCSIFWAIPSVLRDRIKLHKVYMTRSFLLLRGIAALFSIAAILMYLSSSRNPYYFVLLSIWPMTLLATFLNFNGRKPRRSIIILCGVLVAVICWFPSMFWNVMRCRESWIWRESISKQNMITSLASLGVEQAEVYGAPEYFIAAHKAGLRFTPLPFYDYDSGIAPPADAWLLLSPKYVKVLERSRHDVFRGRREIERFRCFPENRYWKNECIVYGPAIDE